MQPPIKKKISSSSNPPVLFKTLGLFLLKLLLLFLLLDLALLAGEDSLWNYNFRHQTDRLANQIWDIQVRLRVHKIAQPKEPGEIRIITIGNSSIHAGGLPYNHSFAYHLQEFFNNTSLKDKVKVYNLGVNAACALDEFLLLRAAAPYRIDYVVWGLTLRDFYTAERDNRMPLGDWNREYFMQQREWLGRHGYEDLYQLFYKPRKNKMDRWNRLNLWLRHHWALWRNQELLREILFDQVITLLPPQIQKDTTSTFMPSLSAFVYFPAKRLYKGAEYPWPNPNFRYLGAIKELLNQQGTQLILFDQPTVFHDNAYPVGWIKRYREVMKGTVPQVGAPYIDLIDLLPAGRDNFHDYLHLTSDGHKKAARVVGDLMMREALPNIGSGSKYGQDSG